MAFILADRVRETASAPGTGTVTLLGAVTGYQTFSAGIGASNTTYYVIADQSGANWEVGLGTIGAGGTTLARTTVLSSSNSGSLVNFSSGTQDVFCDYPAGKAVYQDASNNVTGYAISGGTIDNTPIGATTASTGAFTTLKASGNTLLAQSYDQGTGVLQVTGQSTFNGAVTDKSLNLQGGNNLLVYSQLFSNGNWVQSNSSLSGTLVLAPDGTTTAFTNIDTSSNVSHGLIQNTTFLANTNYTFSVSLKANGQNWCYFQINKPDGTFPRVWFNISTGSIGTTESGISLASISIQPNGYYRCIGSFNSNATAGSATCRIYSATADAVSAYAGSTSNTFNIWGAQLELGTVASAYTPTTTTAVTTTNNISVPSGQVFVQKGSSALPAISIGDSNTGISNGSSGSNGYFQFSIAGTNAMLLDSGTLVGPTRISFTSNNDTYLYRDAANTLAQRNSTNAQTFRLYNTYTDASNYERLSIDWSTTANTATIVTQNAGTGSARNLAIGQDLYVNSVRVGLGGGSLNTNTAVGNGAVGSSNTGVYNSAFGFGILNVNTSGNSNSGFGHQPLNSNTTGSFNCAFGRYALTTNTIGSSSASFGYNALAYNTTASNLTAIGTQALNSNTTNVATLGTITGGSSYTNGTYTGVVMTLSSGSTAITYPTATIVVAGGVVTTVTLTSNGVGFKDTTTVLTAPAASIGGTGSGFSVPVATLASGTGNVAVGYQAGYTNSTGNSNTYLGYQTGYSALTATQNTFVGSATGYSTTGSNNTFFGSGISTTTGTANTAVGAYGTLINNTSGSNLVSIGFYSLNANTSGNNLVAIGREAGRGPSPYTNANTTGSNNTYIGYQTVGSANNNTNEMVIGYGAVGLGSNTTVIGNSSTTLTKVFGAIQATTYTVATLPSASTSGVGARAFVTDALAPVFGSAVAGSGAVPVPVYSTGSAWNVG